MLFGFPELKVMVELLLQMIQILRIMLLGGGVVIGLLVVIITLKMFERK